MRVGADHAAPERTWRNRAQVVVLDRGEDARLDAKRVRNRVDREPAGFPSRAELGADVHGGPPLRRSPQHSTAREPESSAARSGRLPRFRAVEGHRGRIDRVAWRDSAGRPRIHAARQAPSTRHPARAIPAGTSLPPRCDRSRVLLMGSRVHGRLGELMAQDSNSGVMDKVRERASAGLTNQKERATDGLGSIAGAARQTTQQLREQQHDTAAR